MRPGPSVYLYELAWILPSVAIPAAMLVALLVTAFGVGIHVPSDAGRVDPARLSTTPPFDTPGVIQIAPGQYEVRMIGQIWSFIPNEVRVPAGSTVSFVATSRDIVHGLFIPRTTVNVMLLPGQVTRITARFDRAGEYPIICHEYCGIAHHTMAGRLIVEPAARPGAHAEVQAHGP